MAIVLTKKILKMSNLKVDSRKLGVAEYQSLRKTTDWGELDDSAIKIALENDLFSVCVMDQNKIVGMGRVIGDGAIYFYIQDLIVHPDYQGKGIGNLMMIEIEAYLKNNSHNNSFIGLMAAKGANEFYHKFGYSERSPDKPGMFKIIIKP